MTDTRASKVVRFSVFQADLQSGELTKSGLRVRIQEQPFKILASLLEKPNELVTREELRQCIRPKESFGDFDHAIDLAVGKLRTALGDSAGTPRFVETLPRRGYRFIAPVSDVVRESPSRVDAAIPNSSSPENVLSRAHLVRWKRRYLPFVAAATVVLAVFSTLVWRTRAARSISPVIQSLVVLPLENLSGDPSQDYLAEGITDALITNLAEHTSTRVISRTSAMHFKDTRKTLPEIANELNVDVVVEGAVAQADGRVRINVQLIRAADDSHLWAHAYEAEIGDIFALQNQVAGDIAIELPSRETGGQQARLDPPGAQSHDLYLHGIYFSNKVTKDGLEKAISYFNQSLEADRHNALAFVGLAESYCSMGDLVLLPPKEAYPKAKAAALDALKLDPHSAEAHKVLAWIAYAYDWDTVTAEKEFSHSLYLNPNSSNAHAWYGTYLAQTGRIADAAQHIDQARRLDPLSLPILADEFMPLYFSRQYDKAIEVSQRVLGMDPSFTLARDHLIYLYETTGQFEEAINEAERDAIIRGEQSAVASRVAASHRKALLRNGARGYWLLRFNSTIRQPTFDPFEAALLALRLHWREQALRWLERAYDERTLAPFIGQDPAFDELKANPRFQSLVRRISSSHVQQASVPVPFAKLDSREQVAVRRFQFTHPRISPRLMRKPLPVHYFQSV